MEIKELVEKRVKIVADQQALIDKADNEKRALTADEEQTYANLDKEFDEITTKIDEVRKEKEKADAEAERREKLKERQSMSQYEPIKLEPESNGAEPRRIVASDEYVRSFDHLLRVGHRGLTSDEFRTLDFGSRALQADSDVAGGFVVAPEQFAVELIKKKDDMVFIRKLAKKTQLTQAASLGVPVLDNDPDDSTWTAELSTGTDDDAMNFEKRSFVPHPSAKRIRISKTLLRLSAIPVAPLVSERLAYKFAITEEKAFLTGTGSNQPLGLFTDNANGITSANRWVSAGNTNVALKADNLINVKYALKMQYRANAQWIFHRDVIKVIRRLKDGEGNYLWQTSIAADKPDTLLGYPVNESEYAPSTMTTLLAVGILGDFSYYWIVDALDMQIQVLTELYAEKNQNGYIARMETDGMPVVEEAFAVCQMA